MGLGFLQGVLDRGQQDDWFGSAHITVFFMLALAALTRLVVYEWRHPHPILESKLLKNRNFAATVLFNFVLGSVLFGTTVLIPQFLQLMMGLRRREGRRSIVPGRFHANGALPHRRHPLHIG